MPSLLRQHLQRALHIGIIGGVFLAVYDTVTTIWTGDIRLFILGDLLRIFLIPLFLYILFSILVMTTVGTAFFLLYRVNHLPESQHTHVSFQGGVFSFFAAFYIFLDLLNARSAAKPLAVYWQIAFVSIIFAAGIGCGIYLLSRFVQRRTVRVAILAAPLILLVVLATGDILRSHQLPQSFLTLSHKPKVMTAQKKEESQDTVQRPNILWIVMDTVRADHLSAYGYSRETTPNIDAFAKDATLYTNAISPSSWTLPSHAAMLTGMYPSRNGADGAWPWLADGFTTLPEVLRKYGYQTYGFSNNDNFGPKANMQQGFDSYTLFTRGQSLQGQLLLARTIRSFIFTVKARGNLFGLVSLYRFITDENPRKDYGASQTVAATIRGIDMAQSLNRPFFIFENFMEAHDPYGDSPDGGFYLSAFVKPISLSAAVSRQDVLTDDVYAYIVGSATLSDEDKQLITALYDGDLHYVDGQVNEILTVLRERQLLDSTLVIITSDHGENLGEHGLIDHVYDIHRTLTHVPLIIRLPGTFPAGERRDALVQTTDVFPTILDVAHITDWPRTDLQGFSLLGTEKRSFAVSEAEYSNDTFTRTRYVMSQYRNADERLFGGSWRSLHEGESEYIETPNKQLVYNVTNDPAETQDLATQRPALAGQLRKRLLNWIQTFPNYLHTIMNL